MMEIALIENIERENLNPIEEAKAYDNILFVTLNAFFNDNWLNDAMLFNRIS